MEALAKFLNVQTIEVTILFSMLFSIPLVLGLHKLPLRKDTEHAKRDRMVRGIYTSFWGLFFLWLIYSVKEVLLIVFLGALFFYLSKFSTTLKRYFFINIVVFSILFFAHFYRFLFYWDNPNYYGMGFILMILIPRIMYYNQFVYQQLDIKSD